MVLLVIVVTANTSDSEGTQTYMRISLNSIEKILKNNYIFNDIVLASRPRVIKVSPKSDMAIIWINI